MQLGTQLQPDAPLSQSIDQYQSRISAQTGSGQNAQRATLGPEFVEQPVARYQEYRKGKMCPREAVSNHSNALRSGP